MVSYRWLAHNTTHDEWNGQFVRVKSRKSPSIDAKLLAAAEWTNSQYSTERGMDSAIKIQLPAISFTLCSDELSCKLIDGHFFRRSLRISIKLVIGLVLSGRYQFKLNIYHPKAVDERVENLR